MATKQTLVVGELTAVDNTQAAFRSVQNSARKTQQSAKALNQQFRFVRGGAGQLGHQIQDVAVQLQMGTNALIVFGQQGSQIASLMGPQGALIGAVLAVGAAIGVTLLNDTKKATDELKKLSDEIDKFIGKTGLITDEFAAFKKVVAGKELEQQKDRIAELTKEIELGEKLIEGYTRRLEEQEAGLLNAGDAVTGAIAVTVDYSAKIKEQTELLAKNKAELSLLTNTVEKNTQIDKAHTKSVLDEAQRRVNAASRELDEIVKKSELREKRLNAEQKLRMSRLDQLQSINDREMQILIDRDAKEKELFDQRMEREQLEMNLRQAKADNVIANANRELDAIVQAENQKRAAKEAGIALDQQVLASGQALLGSLMSGMDEQSGAYKALFAAQKALAIASTIINTEMAAIAALAPPPVGLGPTAGLPYSKAIRAIGYASAGLIAAQTVASFEGGGFTGRGARSGGVDGRGGFPAILHPNETVIDHQRGGGVTVVQNINIATGVAQTVRAEVLNLMPQIQEATKAAVANSRQRGGSFSKAMAGN